MRSIVPMLPVLPVLLLVLVVAMSKPRFENFSSKEERQARSKSFRLVFARVWASTLLTMMAA
jgi:hypothetical protein